MPIALAFAVAVSLALGFRTIKEDFVPLGTCLLMAVLPNLVWFVTLGLWKTFELQRIYYSTLPFQVNLEVAWNYYKGPFLMMATASSGILLSPDKKDRAVIRFALAWVCAGLLLICSITSFYERYLIFILPLNALLLVTLFNGIQKRFRTPRASVTACLISALVLIGCFAGSPDHKIWMDSFFRDFLSDEMNPFRPSHEKWDDNIPSFFQANARPGDRIQMFYEGMYVALKTNMVVTPLSTFQRTDTRVHVPPSLQGCIPPPEKINWIVKTRFDFLIKEELDYLRSKGFVIKKYDVSVRDRIQSYLPPCHYYPPGDPALNATIWQIVPGTPLKENTSQ